MTVSHLQGPTLTVKGPCGNYVDLVASSKLKRFSEIKVGSKINVRYYDTIVEVSGELRSEFWTEHSETIEL
jgi:hypothetical protein